MRHLTFVPVCLCEADAHQAEVRSIYEITRTTTGHSIIHFTQALQYKHYSGPSVPYGKRSVQMQSRVGLMTRNIVIRGNIHMMQQVRHVVAARCREKNK